MAILFSYVLFKSNANILAEQVKDVIQDLYRVMVQVSSYDSVGKPSKDVLTNEM